VVDESRSVLPFCDKDGWETPAWIVCPSRSGFRLDAPVISGDYDKLAPARKFERISLCDAAMSKIALVAYLTACLLH
jgi:hypothetical protein